jgi:hypothetical protein
MVTFGLIGIATREDRHGSVERIAAAQVAADQRRVSGFGVSTGQSVPTQLGIFAPNTNP